MNRNNNSKNNSSNNSRNNSSNNSSNNSNIKTTELLSLKVCEKTKSFQENEFISRNEILCNESELILWSVYDDNAKPLSH